MKNKKIELLHDVRALLASHQELGLSEYPVNTAVRHFFDKCKPSRKQPLAEPPLSISASSSAPVQNRQRALSPTVPGSGQSGGSLGTIAREVAGCISCALHSDRFCVSSGRGGQGAKLMVVGGWLVGDSSSKADPECVFGVAEDQMLSRMLTAMKLDPGDSFVTNTIKCVLPGSSQPDSACVRSCLPWLHKQISLIRPRVICTMGLVATRALLDFSQPLSRLRGRLYLYENIDGQDIQIVPTYHPTFLLQNPDMKQAVWQDLQLINKQL